MSFEVVFGLCKPEKPPEARRLTLQLIDILVPRVLFAIFLLLRLYCPPYVNGGCDHTPNE